MLTISEAFALALAHHRAGELKAAEVLYRQILASEPNQADALHLLGLIAHQVGQHQVAIEYIERAIALNGMASSYHNNLGTAYHSLQKLPEAAACYRRAIELKPDFAEAHHNLGNALKDQGLLDDAAACYRRAVALNPEGVDTHYQLGNLLQVRGNTSEALDCYLRALALRPNFAEAHNNLGVALQSAGRLDEAAACYRRALAAKFDYAEACNNLGSALQAQGQPHEAMACYRQAADLRPDYAEAHHNLGGMLREQEQLDDAVACYRRALKLRPDFAEAHYYLGVALQTQGQVAEAIACYRRAVECNPEHDAAQSRLLFALHFSPAHDAEAIWQEHLAWNQQRAAPLSRFPLPHTNERSAQRRLRIGYVSPYFCGHALGFYLLPLLAEHDHTQFEIVCYAHGAQRDVFTDRLQECADVWRDVANLGNDAFAQLVRDDRIDILVDTTLHMADNRLLVFARKPAPVQVTFAGYPGTTGLSAMDYRLTDPHLDPPAAGAGHYSEESVRLPDTFWCYRPLADDPEVNGLPALENGYVTFANLNDFAKVNTDTLALWAEVMRAVPRSRLLLLAGEGAHRTRTVEFLQQAGIAADRVTFAPPQLRRQYLELYQRADLVLDSIPYNGHTTSLDAYWMGVPVVTIAGQTAVGRAGVSQLTNLGLPELIAPTREQFVTAAVALAHDLSRLSALRATLRARMQSSPLMDAPRFARHVEAAYRRMWHRWCEK